MVIDMNITAEAFRHHKSREIKRIMLEFRKLKRGKPGSFCLIDQHVRVMKLAALVGRVRTVIMASKPEKSATMLTVNVDKDGD